jgi:predicted phosphohydrolase
MSLFALSDTHLSLYNDKPMDVFGNRWQDYANKLDKGWRAVVTDKDTVVISGDVSWGISLEEAKLDLQYIDSLPGQKIISKGNHEYWWSGITAVRNILPQSISAIQNDCLRIGNLLFCGTRGWTVPEHGKQLPAEDEKLYKREVERLKLTLAKMQQERKPDDTVICLMHFPPYNMTKEDSNFTKLLEEYNIDKVVFGHLHGKLVNMDKVYSKNNIEYYFTSTDHINNTPVLVHSI